MSLVYLSPEPDAPEMKIKYHGHSAFSIYTKGYHLLLDPFITGNPLVSNTDITEIRPDWILISHGHGDHVGDTKEIAATSGAKVISNYEIVNWLKKDNIEGHPINHGGKHQFEFGTVKSVNAVHTGSLPDGTYGGYPGGFVIWNDEGCIYFAGDTALTMDMKLIPLTCPKLDVAILPIGDNFTMGYDDAAIAAEFIECKKIIACHFDTFGYIKTDKSKARKAFEAKGIEIIIPDIGDTMEI